jgi:hypothetical protein
MAASRWCSAIAWNRPRQNVALRMPPPDRPNPSVLSGRRAGSFAGIGGGSDGGVVVVEQLAMARRRSSRSAASAASNSGGYAVGSGVCMPCPSSQRQPRDAKPVDAECPSPRGLSPCVRYLRARRIVLPVRTSTARKRRAKHAKFRAVAPLAQRAGVGHIASPPESGSWPCTAMSCLLQEGDWRGASYS